MKNTADIPKGEFCYRLVPLRPGERLSREIGRFGKDLREFPYGANHKEVLCPYWHRTDYGMVRCDYLEVQTLDEDDPDARDKAIRHCGSEELFDKANTSSYLYDEMKICEVNLDEDGELEEPPA